MRERSNRTGVFTTINGERREIAVEVLDPIQAAIYRSWTPAQRLKAGADQSRFVRRLLKGQLSSLHPEWTEEEVEREVVRRFLGNSV